MLNFKKIENMLGSIALLAIPILLWNQIKTGQWPYVAVAVGCVCLGLYSIFPKVGRVAFFVSLAIAIPLICYFSRIGSAIALTILVISALDKYPGPSDAK